ncbi:MAG: hypothetical protein HQ510_09505 [Candidatus Marinimicrobia bacterium]|nr:hypothetical protein [Candidatus Neomarinimicrobiota bacterium]
MKFSVFFSIAFGVGLIMYAVGYVVGFYVHSVIETKYWAYISIPIVGAGSALVFYGTLFRRDLG